MVCVPSDAQRNLCCSFGVCLPTAVSLLVIGALAFAVRASVWVAARSHRTR
jgi:hypothetical protein